MVGEVILIQPCLLPHPKEPWVFNGWKFVVISNHFPMVKVLKRSNWNRYEWIGLQHVESMVGLPRHREMMRAHFQRRDDDTSTNTNKKGSNLPRSFIAAKKKLEIGKNQRVTVFEFGDSTCFIMENPSTGCVWMIELKLFFCHHIVMEFFVAKVSTNRMSL